MISCDIFNLFKCTTSHQAQLFLWCLLPWTSHWWTDFSSV